MKERTHIDIFSGIGGFALAAMANGVETEVFCENNDECCDFLEKQWGLPIVRDIRDFDGTQWRGRWLLTGGVPCQPASRAGKQRGAGDVRWLWPEALRVLEEARPTWCIFENPPGIDDVGLDGILAEMGRVGYEVQPFDIPACAMDSPQLRRRYYLVGHSIGERCSARRADHGEDDRTEPGPAVQISLGYAAGRGFGIDGGASGSGGHSDESGAFGSMGHTQSRQRPVLQREGRGEDSNAGRSVVDLANSSKLRCQDVQEIGGVSANGEDKRRLRQFEGIRPDAWSNYVWVPCADGKVRRAPDDTFLLVDGLHRSLLQALGNSIVPQVAAQILKAMIQSEVADDQQGIVLGEVVHE